MQHPETHYSSRKPDNDFHSRVRLWFSRQLDISVHWWAMESCQHRHYAESCHRRDSSPNFDRPSRAAVHSRDIEGSRPSLRCRQSPPCLMDPPSLSPMYAGPSQIPFLHVHHRSTVRRDYDEAWKRWAWCRCDESSQVDSMNGKRHVTLPCRWAPRLVDRISAPIGRETHTNRTWQIRYQINQCSLVPKTSHAFLPFRIISANSVISKFRYSHPWDI